MTGKLRQYYGTYIARPWLDRGIRRTLDFIMNGVAHCRHFSFPNTYNDGLHWYWKRDMLCKSYEKETVALFKNIISPGMTIVDIGAHIGYYTLLFSSFTGKNGQVYAFEADRENFALLKKNTSRVANIHNFDIAVSDAVDSINFYHSNEKSGCHSTIPGELRTQKVVVSATDLDSFMAKQGVKKIDVIKMDIEGGELAALEGMRKVLQQNPGIALVTEFNPDCLKEARIEALDFLKKIAELGFSIFGIRENGLSKIILQKDTRVSDVLLGKKFINIYCARDQYAHRIHNA